MRFGQEWPETVWPIEPFRRHPIASSIIATLRAEAWHASSSEPQPPAYW